MAIHSKRQPVNPILLYPLVPMYNKTRLMSPLARQRTQFSLPHRVARFRQVDYGALDFRHQLKTIAHPLASKATLSLGTEREMVWAFRVKRKRKMKIASQSKCRKKDKSWDNFKTRRCTYHELVPH